MLVIPPSIAATKSSGRKAPAKEAGPSITWVNQLKAGQSLPTNTTHRTFRSAVANQDVGYCLYLPPGYADSGDRRYPVIYNLHGNGGNEFHSFEDVQVLHDGIVAGKWPPMIVALPNGGKSTFYKDSYDGRFPIETMFIQEFIPHIDATFRTIAARHGRCLEGFSMGGRGSMRLAVKYPELFCSVFCQAGNVPRTAENFDAENWKSYLGGYLGPDRRRYEADDVFLLTEKNLAAIQAGLRIQIACGTRDDGHLPTIRDYHAHLVKLGVDHTYLELEGLGHQRTKMIELLKPVWFDYQVESLRRAAEKAARQTN